MTLLWKLLRSHLSVAQTIGFALAGLVGMTVVLTALQAYRDVLPVFEGPDSFAEGDYLVLSKRVGTLQAIGIGNSDFTPEELEELRAQPLSLIHIWCRWSIRSVISTRANFGCGASISVSYTHLDVYKRQPQAGPTG